MMRGYSSGECQGEVQEEVAVGGCDLPFLHTALVEGLSSLDTDITIQTRVPVKLRIRTRLDCSFHVEASDSLTCNRVQD